MDRTPEFTHAVSGNHRTLIGLGIALLVLSLDLLTGPQVLFPILYVVPVTVTGWLNKGLLAYFLAGALPVARFLFFLRWDQTDSLYLLAVNTIIRMAALLIIAYLVNRTAIQSRRVHLLEGLLKICSSCKRIQNEKGEYESVEKYISGHSAVQFSHGLCVECVRKLYPEYVDREES